MRLKRRFWGFVTRYSLLIIWILANIIIFICTFDKYKNEPQYYYLRQMLGYGLCLSRSSGTMINVSCALILLPMCRCFTTAVRTWNRRVSLSFIRSAMDRCKAIHISCAYTMICASVIHTVSHIVNAYNFCRHFSTDHPDLNLAEFSGQNPIIAMFPTVPGISGILMIIIMAVVLITSLKAVRMKYYNLFWYSHHLITVFLLLLLCHPLSGILKEQINLAEHPPGCVYINSDESAGPYCSSHPRFQRQESQTWKWMIVPLCIYALDFVFRRVQRSECVTVLRVVHLPSSVVELKLRRDNFGPKPGQFVVMNCPSVSSFEWHPFSVSSCDGDSSFNVHIRIRGDWSSRLGNLLTEMPRVEEHSCPSKKLVNLYVDGPFGSPFEDVLLGPISICVAGGIGITPFASILRALLTDDEKFRRLRRLHLIWLCRSVSSFTWFTDLLCQLHIKMCVASIDESYVLILGSDPTRLGY